LPEIAGLMALVSCTASLFIALISVFSVGQGRHVGADF